MLDHKECAQVSIVRAPGTISPLKQSTGRSDLSRMQKDRFILLSLLALVVDFH
jgi:hypothetical protein